MRDIRPTTSMIAALVLASALGGCTTLRAATAQCDQDAKIRINVQDLIDARAGLGAPGSIRVQSIDGVVYLSGLVDTGPEKGLAETVAAHAPGVARVVNSIEQNN